MITFKVLKYKHYRKANELQNNGANENELLDFAISLIKEWDFVDVETNEPLTFEDTDELSIDQINEIFTSFTEAFNKETKIPNAKSEI